MNNYKIKYNIGNTINNIIEIKANNVNEMYTIFFDTLGSTADVIEIMEITEV